MGIVAKAHHPKHVQGEKRARPDALLYKEHKRDNYDYKRESCIGVHHEVVCVMVGVFQRVMFERLILSFGDPSGVCTDGIGVPCMRAGSISRDICC